MLSIPELGAAIDEHAAIRRIRRMQPAGGVGDKLFPPTYPPKREGPPRHVFERRRLDDREVWCVLIDSVQSQANRMEEALLAASAEEAIPLPYVTVDFREAGLQRRSWVWIRRSVGLLYTSTLRSTPSGSMRRQGSSGQGS